AGERGLRDRGERLIAEEPLLAGEEPDREEVAALRAGDGFVGRQRQAARWRRRRIAAAPIPSTGTRKRRAAPGPRWPGTSQPQPFGRVLIFSSSVSSRPSFGTKPVAVPVGVTSVG